MNDYGALLLAISRAGVDYVVIDGLAVGVNGYVRATKDVDIVPAPADAVARGALVWPRTGDKMNLAGIRHATLDTRLFRS